MPIDYSQYPVNWKSEIVPWIRARAGDKCEWCGVPNHSIIRRNTDATWDLCYSSDTAGAFLRQHGTRHLRAVGLTYVICTTAHVGVNKHNKMACGDADLAYLCQKCHLGYDLTDHIQHRRENREKKLGIIPMVF